MNRLILNYGDRITYLEYIFPPGMVVEIPENLFYIWNKRSFFKFRITNQQLRTLPFNWITNT